MLTGEIAERGFDYFEDKPREECGVIGVILPVNDPDIGDRVREGLEALQHRGQEAAGVAIADSQSQEISVIKNTGMVAEALGGNTLKGQNGSLAIGHVRYGTAGDKSPELQFNAAQPFVVESALEDGRQVSIALAHNGHVENAKAICEKYGIDTTEHVSDTESLTRAVAEVRKRTNCLAAAIKEVFDQAEGAYSLTVLGEGQLIALRDPYGFRPLTLGTFEGGGYSVASESSAHVNMGATYQREIARGEMVVISDGGRTLKCEFPFEQKPSALCAFEFVYFHAPQGELEGRSVYMVRKKMGEILAREHPVVSKDPELEVVVVGVPDSGIPASEGFSAVSCIKRVSGLIKNRYLSKRTFIIPGQDKRRLAVRKKLDVIVPEVFGKSVVLVDDSIVRGTTMQEVVRMLRAAGAKEVHLRISSAPYKWPCFYGMDTGDPSELVANMINDHQALVEYLGVDSLGYLSVAGLREAASDAAGKLCMACMTAEYPTRVPVNIQGY